MAIFINHDSSSGTYHSGGGSRSFCVTENTNSGKDVGSFGSNNGFEALTNLGITSSKEYNDLVSSENDKNRSFQEYMSSSAHTREVQDLLNAGLNPVLSASGSGASSGSGSSMNYESQAGVYTALMTALINQQTQLGVASINANSAVDVAKQYGENTLSANSDKYYNMPSLGQLAAQAVSNAKQKLNEVFEKANNIHHSK